MRSFHATAFRSTAWLVLALIACDMPGGEGPRILPTSDTVLPYPVVADPPPSTAKAEASGAEHYVVVSDRSLEIGRRHALPEPVALADLLRTLWRLRGDPLGSYSAASISSAPFLLASRTVPLDRIAAVVTALWRHGAHLLVAGGADGAPRAHPVHLLAAEVVESRAVVPAGRAVLAVEGGQLILHLPGEAGRPMAVTGVPTAADLVRGMDAAATAGVRTLLLRESAASPRDATPPVPLPSPTPE